jgi:hypothetical protein
MILGAPLPDLDDEETAPFWHACAAGELHVQRCTACGRFRFPPRPVCPYCHAMGREWAQVSGRGFVWSLAVPHPPLLPAYEPLAPYNVVVVTLDDDPTIRLVGNLVAGLDAPINSVDPATITIGEPVRVVFQPLSAGVVIPRWVRA